MAKAWFFLLVAGIAEWGWPVGLKLGWTDAGVQWSWIILALVCMGVSGWLLLLAQLKIPMGTGLRGLDRHWGRRDFSARNVAVQGAGEAGQVFFRGVDRRGNRRFENGVVTSQRKLAVRGHLLLPPEQFGSIRERFFTILC